MKRYHFLLAPLFVMLSFVIGCHDEQKISPYQFQGNMDVRVTGDQTPSSDNTTTPPTITTTTTTNSQTPAATTPQAPGTVPGTNVTNTTHDTTTTVQRPTYTPGDINGDGVREFLITAPFAVRGGNDVGAVDIYSSGNMTRLARLEGEQAGTFGTSVTMLGDLNDDGYEDFAVGDEGVVTVQGLPQALPSGQVIIFAGGSDLTSLRPLITLRGETAGDRFGAVVMSLGDINGDARADFAVGAPEFSGMNNGVPTSKSGKVYIYSGSDFAQIATLESGKIETLLGASLALAGDTNNDGVRELMVGAPGITRSPGEVFLFPLSRLEGQVMTANAQVTLTGETAGDNFGWAFVSMGDVDGDNMSEIAVSAPNADTKWGRIYGFRGRDMSVASNLTVGGNSFPILTCLPPFISVRNIPSVCGYSLALIGDLNRNGTNELLIGSPGANGQRGTVQAIDTNTLMGVMQITGMNARDSLGGNISVMFDIDGGDGIPEIMVAASFAGRGNGEVYIFSGALARSGSIVDITQASFTFQGQNQENLGFSLFTP
ncbi:MAG: hypothetical protein A3I05_00355 [Deltaproteobacteria bacterium RIFCSPLOWO2_02_FULL_44_10]|nr:MAG: hypothetical protein A3C46_01220 [Deltaproteobacteria bacterium RIFCSPHIGHO2_02_FULL_44_16]OGQ47257.1 MAG: hypothetical protein A3I05_00355 [Deltaproteobacteria bacterium RIFCSPLOWO2_02_FULL_44_10]